MENDYRKLWADCLAMIRARYVGQQSDEKKRKECQHWFDTWFGEVRFESYDADTHTLLVQVPNKHVYEYLETYCVNDLQRTTKAVFNTEVKINYRLPSAPQPQQPDMAQLIAELKRRGFNTGGEPPHVRIPDAGQKMRQCLKEFVGDGYQWLPAYDKVAAWLTDNRSRGLLCVGFSGTGKSMICRRVLPVLLGVDNVAIATAIEMTNYDAKTHTLRLDELLKKPIIVIDGELGHEAIEPKFFGHIRRPFAELCDAAEQQGKLLILSTNCLSTVPMEDTWRWKRLFPISFEERYGQDVTARLKTSMLSVNFAGANFWQKQK